MLSIQALLNLQKELDYHFESVEEINKNEILTSNILGLMVEVGEFANEVQSFKYWKKNKHISNSKTKEEFADILFFYLSIANQIGLKGEEIEEAYLDKYEKNRIRINEGY